MRYQSWRCLESTSRCASVPMAKMLISAARPVSRTQYPARKKRVCTIRAFLVNKEPERIRPSTKTRSEASVNRSYHGSKASPRLVRICAPGPPHVDVSCCCWSMQFDESGRRLRSSAPFTYKSLLPKALNFPPAAWQFPLRTIPRDPLV